MKKIFEVWQLYFEVLATSKNTQYIYFTYTLWGAIVGSEVSQLQKKVFSENSLVFMLYIWHSGCFMKPTHKLYFWPFLYPKIAFFVTFAQKKCEFLNGRHNFFCICRLTRLKIHVRGLLLYFQKNKKFLKLANFSRTCTPLKIENHEKKICFSWFSILRGVQVLLKLANFKKFLFFWKCNSKPLTFIFNLVRRQIKKKICQQFKNSYCLGKFGQKWQKMRFLGIKMVKNIICGLVSWNNHYARCKA